MGSEQAARDSRKNGDRKEEGWSLGKRDRKRERVIDINRAIEGVIDKAGANEREIERRERGANATLERDRITKNKMNPTCKWCYTLHLLQMAINCADDSSVRVWIHNEKTGNEMKRNKSRKFGIGKKVISR